MHDYQRKFIEFTLENNILSFGEFTLKSGRISPYFFNAGLFNTGALLAQLGHFYAAAIQQAQPNYDMLFGPAYKGIPLATATVLSLYEHYQQDIPYCFNRKEAKDHGEGGQLVGSPLAGRVLIVDDVITAGTAIRESMQIIEPSGATLAGVLIALDRQERGNGAISAIQEIENTFKAPVYSIVKFEHLVTYLEQRDDNAGLIDAMNTYRVEYGCSEHNVG